MKSKCMCAPNGTCHLVRKHGDKCCRCMDKRNARDVLYVSVHVDGIGDVRPIDYDVLWPRDMDYCPACKRTPHSSAEIYAFIRGYIHEMFNGPIAPLERVLGYK